jgi:hypothetical protein
MHKTSWVMPIGGRQFLVTYNITISAAPRSHMKAPKAPRPQARTGGVRGSTAIKGASTNQLKIARPNQTCFGREMAPPMARCRFWRRAKAKAMKVTMIAPISAPR